MGGAPSAPPPPPPPPPLFEEPWRKVSENYKDNLVFVKSYHPQNEQIRHLRILLYGPVGAGKSSFINSVDTVLRGRPASRAVTDANSASSVTKQYKTFQFRKIAGAKYSFVFNDIMGLEDDFYSGISVKDVELALRGHVKDGYKFNPHQQLMEGDDGYNSDPTLEDKVHVLVCVVPANAMYTLSEEMWKKMRKVRLAASELGIPQLAIFTRVDEACPEVKKDTSNIYKSKYLKELVERFHRWLGIPMNCIFLVKNCIEETESNDKMNTAIVCALKQMLCCGEEFLENMETSESGNVKMVKGYPAQVSAPPYPGPPMNYGVPTTSVSSVTRTPALQDAPGQMLCPYCNQSLGPIMDEVEGQVKWEICGLSISGRYLCHCLPCCIYGCKDVKIRCPSCNRII